MKGPSVIQCYSVCGRVFCFFGTVFKPLILLFFKLHKQKSRPFVCRR